MSKKVYLAGPITGLEFDEAKDWRDSSSPFVRRLRALGWTELSPMRNKEKFRVQGKLSAFFDEGAAAVQQDLTDIEEAEAVILNVLGATHVSLGSMAEMGYAYALGRPVILVTEGEDNCHHHVFTDYMGTVQVSSLNAAIKALQNLYKQVVVEKVPYAPPLPGRESIWVLT
jgi:nucleoside 2-deoxyribosyltransferase